MIAVRPLVTGACGHHFSQSALAHGGCLGATYQAVVAGSSGQAALGLVAGIHRSSAEAGSVDASVPAMQARSKSMQWTNLMISILLRGRGGLAVAAVVGRLRRGRRLIAAILLRRPVSVSTTPNVGPQRALTGRRSCLEADSPGEGRSSAEGEPRSSVVRRCSPAPDSKTCRDAVARADVVSCSLGDAVGCWEWRMQRL